MRHHGIVDVHKTAKVRTTIPAVEERLPAGLVNAYTYDALDRLTQAKTTSSSGSVRDDFRYAWDAVGNRTSETVRQAGLLGASDVTTTSSFNAADQLTIRGGVTYSYDANGNQTASSAGQALAYNGADQTTVADRRKCRFTITEDVGGPGCLGGLL